MEQPMRFCAHKAYPAIQQNDAMMPGTFNSKVCDGSVSQLLERLAQVDTVET